KEVAPLVRACHFACAHAAAFSLAGLRDPSITSCRSAISFVAIVAPTIPVPRTPILIFSSPFALSTRIGFKSTRELHCIGDLLKARDHAVAHRSYVRETRLEGFAGGFRLRRICANGDNVVARFKKFGRLSAPILKIGE